MEPILARFGGVRSVWRIGRGGSRSTFVEIHFFCLRERLGLDFAPPRPPFGGSLTLFGRSLAPPDRSLGAPVGSKGAFCASLGATLDASGGALGRSGAPLGPPMAPWALRGPFWGRFGVDFWSISDRFWVDFLCGLHATVLSWCFDFSFDGLLPTTCSFNRPGLSNAGPSHMCAARVASTD